MNVDIVLKRDIHSQRDHQKGYSQSKRSSKGVIHSQRDHQKIAVKKPSNVLKSTKRSVPVNSRYYRSNQTTNFFQRKKNSCY